MSDSSQFYGPNAAYVLDLYDRFQNDPNSVDPATRAFFANWSSEPASSPVAISVVEPSLPEEPVTPVPTPLTIQKIVHVARVCRMVREKGHLSARLDPLGSPPPGDPDLEIETHSITPQDLQALPASVIGDPLAEGADNAEEALERLRGVYSGTIGYETDHIQDAEERDWLYAAIESRRYFQGFSPKNRRELLHRLSEVDTFEQFLEKTFRGTKRFSIEGTDMLVPMLDELIRSSAASGTEEIVIGMAHRGRLNVLAHVMGKPYDAILTGFETVTKNENATIASAGNSSIGWTGDVKYHLGYHRAYTHSSEEMELTLVPNPSHLEFVNPVVEGHTRAGQDQRTQAGPPVQNEHEALAILIHGDAAFPGQGVVAETLNLSRLNGYNTGGTIHIIANNQIGFTTLPGDGRSTLYAADLAKGFEIPIIHVNADDPIACLAVARMAHAYRERFRKDFLIDLIGYRRYGHNEGEEPAFTQPQMYDVIRAHPRIREQWADTLVAEGVVTREEAEAMVQAVEEKLKAARGKPATPTQAFDDMENASRSGRGSIQTGVAEERLRALDAALAARPEGFTTNEKLETRVLQRRRQAMEQGQGINFGHAESLAFASILAEGTPIRLSGQDSERGTFGHRHAVLHDPITGTRYTPLQNIPQARAAFAVYNSPLSENAVLGFEYGYSMHAPGVLVLWEAQFGDFVNGAQVIVDQFLVSGNAKWRQTPSLVLLLPHGYEGMGPEHSSARVERFLQLAATDNIRIVNCTTAAQYFHLLRRQAALLETDPRPLIVMTPKSLLNEPLAASTLADLMEGSFRPVLEDARAREHPHEITRLILSSGKVSIDLIKHKLFAETTRVAAVRVEELYPFPADELRHIIAGYPNLQEIVWMQEEPCNMGPWLFVAPRLRDAEMVGWKGRLEYSGRSEAASPAEGSSLRHTGEQERILLSALTHVPELPAPRTVAQAR